MRLHDCWIGRPSFSERLGHILLGFITTGTVNNMPPRRSSATVRAVATAATRGAAATPMTVAAVEQLIEARVSAALANHETL
ncbi:hypothetical protein Tco_0176028 [Tanacetum coccineum]